MWLINIRETEAGGSQVSVSQASIVRFFLKKQNKNKIWLESTYAHLPPDSPLMASLPQIPCDQCGLLSDPL